MLASPIVAPRAGARIETRDALTRRDLLRTSPPVRGRGLKRGRLLGRAGFGQVAPRAGARIETDPKAHTRYKASSPPVRGRGLKLVDGYDMLAAKSRPPCGGAD